MLRFLVFCAAITCINCIPPAAIESLSLPIPEVRKPARYETVPIVSQDSRVDSEGTFRWSYESADGTKVEQTGEIKTLEKDVLETISGSYSYQDPEGKTHVVRYTAGENGFLPSGDDIAPEIIWNLEQIATHPQPTNTEEFT